MLRALCFLALAAPAFAQLVWEKPWQEFHASPDEKQVVTNFAFRNTGTAPVTIKSVRNGCGCISTDLAKKTYAPGESGAVVAKFTFGSRRGGYRKLITITTSDGTKQELNFVVYINEPLAFSKSLLWWRAGQPAAPQEVVLTPAAGMPVRVLGVTCSNPRFAVRLEAGNEGAGYRIVVQPADTAQRDSAELTVQTDYPPAAPRSYTLHARIK